MRFMMLLPAPAEPLEKAVAVPDKEPVTAMLKFNEERRRPACFSLPKGSTPRPKARASAYRAVSGS
jgi:hypothetical protein